MSARKGKNERERGDEKNLSERKENERIPPRLYSARDDGTMDVKMDTNGFMRS